MYKCLFVGFEFSQHIARLSKEFSNLRSRIFSPCTPVIFHIRSNCSSIRFDFHKWFESNSQRFNISTFFCPLKLLRNPTLTSEIFSALCSPPFANFYSFHPFDSSFTRLNYVEKSRLFNPIMENGYLSKEKIFLLYSDTDRISYFTFVVLPKTIYDGKNFANLNNNRINRHRRCVKLVENVELENDLCNFSLSFPLPSPAFHIVRGKFSQNNDDEVKWKKMGRNFCPSHVDQY